MLPEMDKKATYYKHAKKGDARVHATYAKRAKITKTSKAHMGTKNYEV